MLAGPARQQVDPIVDTLESGMPRDLSWVGLRKMISDPDRCAGAVGRRRARKLRAAGKS